MKKIFFVIALWLGLGLSGVYAQEVDAQFTADDFSIDSFSPMYAWDFSGGPYMFAGEMMESSTTQQLVLIKDKKRAQYYDIKGAGNYIGRDLPSPVVLLSNASGNLFAYSGEDNKIRIASSLQDEYTFSEKNPATALALTNKRSSQLAVAVKDETGEMVVKLYELVWDWANDGKKVLKLLLTFKGLGTMSPNTLVFSHQDAKLLAADDTQVMVWDTETGKEIGKHTIKKELMMDKVRFPTVADKVNRIAYAKNRNTLLLVDFDNGTETTMEAEKFVQDVCLSPDGKDLYSCLSGVFWKYSTSTGALVSTINVNAPMTHCTFSPNGMFALIVPFSRANIKSIRLKW